MKCAYKTGGASFFLMMVVCLTTLMECVLIFWGVLNYEL